MQLCRHARHALCRHATVQPDMPARQARHALCRPVVEKDFYFYFLFFLETRQDPCSMDGSLVSLPPRRAGGDQEGEGGG